MAGAVVRILSISCVAGLVLGPASLTVASSTPLDGSVQQIQSASEIAALSGIGRARAGARRVRGSSPFSQPGKVVKVPVNETFLKSYGGDYGVYGWDTWRHGRDYFLFTSDIDEEQFWIRGHVIIQPVGGEAVHVGPGDFTVLPKGTPLKFTITSPLWIRYRQTYDKVPVPEGHSPWYRKDEIVKFKANETFVKDLGGDSWEDWAYPKGYREFLELLHDAQVYVHEGHGTFEVDGGDLVSYKAGDFVVMPAGMMLVVHVEAHTRAKGVEIP